jgi:hypothetical protein
MVISSLEFAMREKLLFKMQYRNNTFFWGRCYKNDIIEVFLRKGNDYVGRVALLSFNYFEFM